MNMSKAYEMISESLNEIIKDLEENDGKNLKREMMSIKNDKMNKLSKKIVYKDRPEENFMEQTVV